MRIAVVLIIIGIIVGAVFYGHAQGQKKRKVEAAALAAEITKGVEQYSAVTQSLAGLEEAGEKIWDSVTAASNLVPEIVGQDMAPRVYDRDFGKPKTIKMPKKPEGSTPAGTNAAPPKAEIKTGMVVDEFGREAPAGYVVRVAEDKEKPAPAAAKPAGETGGSGKDAVIDGGAGGQRLAQTRTLYLKVLELAHNVETNLDVVVMMRSDGEKVANSVKTALTASNAAKARTGFTELPAMAKQLRESIETDIAEADVCLKDLGKLKDEVSAEKAAAEAAEAKKRAAEDLAASKGREIASANEWYSGKADKIRDLKFAEVADEIQSLQKSLTFEESKDILRVPIQRYRLLAAVMKWLKDQFNKAPLTWGWTTPSGKLDIASADDKGIYVQEKLIAWKDIPRERVIGFFTHYLERSDDVGKSKADLYAGAALFCKTFGYDDFVMDKFVDKAKSESDITAKEIPALLDFQVDKTLVPE